MSGFGKFQFFCKMLHDILYFKIYQALEQGSHYQDYIKINYYLLIHIC